MSGSQDDVNLFDLQGYMELVNLIRKHVNDDRPQGFQAKGLSVDDEDMFLAPKTQSQSHDGEIILYVDQFGLTLSVSKALIHTPHSSHSALRHRRAR